MSLKEMIEVLHPKKELSPILTIVNPIINKMRQVSSVSICENNLPIQTNRSHNMRYEEPTQSTS